MIQSYHFGRMEVGGRIYRQDLKVIQGKVVGNWRRNAGHYLIREDLENVLAAGPEIVAVGTGAYGAMQIDPQLIRTLEARAIRLIAKPTAQAVLSFNRHYSANGNVAGLFHLTC